ncbi:hypothetical protein Vi05172_g6237 [Venturia inaequalis]|nr:hypothetical protein Vi05172_g6237 [Venturia inaequalis]
MYRSLTSTKSFNGLRQRAERVEQIHRRAEDRYRTLAWEYFQMTCLRQKLLHDGENSLPFQLFIAPRGVKLDTWYLDFQRVDLLVQDAFRLFSSFPFAVERIAAGLDKADRGLKRIHAKLEILAQAIDEQIQVAALEEFDAEAWNLGYEELQRQERDAFAAWTMTLPETRKQIELGLTMEDILKEHLGAGLNGIEDKGVPVDGIDHGPVDSAPYVFF